MKLIQRYRGLFLACIASIAMISPLAAQAKGVAVLNTGDELFEVAPLPIALQAKLPEKFKLGYKCSRFGVFWADIWTWNCTLAAVDVAGDTYADLPKAIQSELEQRHSMADAKRSFWNHYGAVLMGTLIGGLFLFGALTAIRRQDDGEAQQA